MRKFLDTSILVEACLVQSPGFKAADALVKSRRAVTSAHALAEAYATLSGDVRIRISPQDASRMVRDLADMLDVHALTAEQYISLIQEAPEASIRGSSFFDAIHAQVARKAKCDEIYTLNVRHFKHVAPDLTVSGL